MVSTFISLLDIQSWWEIPCIAHFCSLFSTAFDLPDIDIEDLETALLNDGTEETVGLLPELICRLLKGCDFLHNRGEITTSNYQMFLRRFLRQQCRKYKTENYFDSDIDFQSLPLRNKLLILHSLCHFRLESKNVESILSNLEADSLRVEPLGYDTKNSRYWYFFGTRLYREDTKQGGKSKIWQVICFTEEDWQNLAAKFKNSTSSKERALHKILVQNFLPKLPQLFRERERQRRRKLLQLRNPARIANLFEEDGKETGKKNSEVEEEILRPAKSFKTYCESRSPTNSTVSENSAYDCLQNKPFATFEIESSPQTRISRLTTKRKSSQNSSFGPKSYKETYKRNWSPKKLIERRCSSESSLSDQDTPYLICQEDKENIVEKKGNSPKQIFKTREDSKCVEMAPTTNTKLPGRQTNNSLSALPGNIFISPSIFTNCNEPDSEKQITLKAEESLREQDSSVSSSISSDSTSKKKKMKLSEIFTETDEVLQIGMHKVLVYVKNHRDAWPFMDPVEEDIAPRYYTIIRRPMDLLKMEEKLDNGEYRKFSDFRNDFKLIVNNCRLYNGQNNEYTDMVNNLQEAFDKATKKYFDQNSSDEDVNLEYPDDKTNIFREKYFNKSVNKCQQKETIKKCKGKRSKQLLGKYPQVEEKIHSISIVDKAKRKDRDKRRRKKTKLSLTSKNSQKKRTENPAVDDGADKNNTFSSTDENMKNNGHVKAKVSKKKNENAFKTNDSESFFPKPGVGLGNKENENSNKKPDIDADHKHLKSEQNIIDTISDDEPSENCSGANSANDFMHKNSLKLQPDRKREKPGNKRTKLLSRKKKHSKIRRVIENDGPVLSTSKSDLSDSGSKVETNESEAIKIKERSKQRKYKSKFSTSKRIGKKRYINATKETKSRPCSVKKPSRINETLSVVKELQESDEKCSANSSAIAPPEVLDCTKVSDSNQKSNGGLAEQIILPFMDKYDLIKQRRNRSLEVSVLPISKENENHKEDKKILPKPTSASPIKGKLQQGKLQEVKYKNRLHKTMHVENLNEDLESNPREKNDAKDCGKNQETHSKDNNKNVQKEQISCSAGSNHYDFVDELTENSKKELKKNEFKNKDNKKYSKKTKGINTEKKVTKNTNMEALELETEQTLKDINRWLEHTPRFSEFSSASNSPSRYNLLDDFDAVASKLDPADFRRPLQISSEKPEEDTKLNDNFEDIIDSKKSIEIEFETNEPLASKNETIDAVNLNNVTPNNSKNKESTHSLITGQIVARQLPTITNAKIQQKEIKRKTLKEKLSVSSKRRDILRTIDRLQPGKLKGNLISNMHCPNKQDEMPPGMLKFKEIKNSLVVKTDENGPKLSLGSVLNTEGFGLGQLHNFASDGPSSGAKIAESMSCDEKNKEEVNKVDISEVEERNEKEDCKNNSSYADNDGKLTTKPEKSGTPNLSAWFKAFGAPKKARKMEEDDKKIDIDEPGVPLQDKTSCESLNNSNALQAIKSPTNNENISLPLQRPRKASTGSTISERSSFSQDPDSPRVGIDERYGVFPGTYASPLGASPIMVSPKPEEINKTLLCPLNGAIKVGFYQDTTTKSSPEKSCSPRAIPSPYPQYSNIYSAEPTVSNQEGNTYDTCFDSTEKTKPSYGVVNSPVYNQYKQPDTQTSVSPNNNSTSPYQQTQNSPYQAQNSPYENTESSPYQSTPSSPYNIQSPGATTGHNPQTAMQQQIQQTKPPQDSNSPYNQSCSSPYQQQLTSPYSQNPSSPYQASQQTVVFSPQQSNLQQNDPIHAANEDSYTSTNQRYEVREENDSYRHVSAQEQIKNFNPALSENSGDIINKEKNSWANRVRDLTQTSTIDNANVPGSTNILANALNNQTVSSSQINDINHLGIEIGEKSNIPYTSFSQYTNEKNNGKNQSTSTLYSSTNLLNAQSLEKCSQPNTEKNAQQNRNLINVDYNSSQLQKASKAVDEIKSFECTLNKQQQMFDSFLGSMSSNSKENLFSKPTEITSSKAFEVFNRAATIGFNKEFGNNISNKVCQDGGPPQVATRHSQQNPYGINTVKNMDDSQDVENNKPLGIMNNFSHVNIHTSVVERKPQNFGNTMTSGLLSNKFDDVNSHQNVYTQGTKQPSEQETYQGGQIDGNKISNELLLSANRQDPVTSSIRSQHLNMDLSNYKQTFNNPTSILDPLRNLNHPLSMLEDNMMNVQNSAPSGYYDKNIPPAHMYTKTLPQFQSSHYSNREQSESISAPTNFLQSHAMNITNIETSEAQNQKHSKKMKKKKCSGINPGTDLIGSQSQTSSLHMHSQLTNATIQNNINTQQGFQLYSGLKTVVASNGATIAGSSESIKNSSAMVHGNAFNFGPSGSTISLPTPIYGDNSTYLDDFRSSTNPYYISPSSRTANSNVLEKANASSGTTSAYHQFLPHGPPRASYPFINSTQLDPASPLYQQYLQRQQEEFRARMMGLNPGILSSSDVTGYNQTNYRPPLGMSKHYDMNTMNRQTWF